MILFSEETNVDPNFDAIEPISAHTSPESLDLFMRRYCLKKQYLGEISLRAAWGTE